MEGKDYEPDTMIQNVSPISSPAYDKEHGAEKIADGKPTYFKSQASKDLSLIHIFKVSPDNATNKNLAFESSDKTIATVSETGVVTFLKAGSVTITVKSEADSSKSDSFTVTVSEKKEEKSGCGSSVAAASIIFAAGALAAAVLVIAKKRAE